MNALPVVESFDAADLLAYGACSPRCLLAMETPQGWVGCQCVCDGRYHAALTFAPVPLSAERAESVSEGHPGISSLSEARDGNRVVLVLEYAIDPDADPDAVERAVRDYVRRLQGVPLFAPMNPPVVHAAIRDDARKVLAVFDR